MSFQLNFNHRHQYQYLETGITLDVVLKYASNQFQGKAKADCGAQYCLFSREIGETLGIDVEMGIKRTFGTLTGSLIAFGHEVSMVTLGIAIETTVYFAREYNLPRNLLGRHGWLQLIRLAVIDYDGELYVSPYNQSL